MKQAKSKFSIADMVTVNCGMVDPDFGQDISGWIGTVENIRYADEVGYIYTLRWSDETLCESSVLRVSCEELGLDFETMQLIESDLSLYSSARAKQFVKQCLNVPRRERAFCYGDFSFY
ncbi:hypothetical protein ACQKPX_14640 [Photobacterium sp. DNB23_23_1]|uniref:Uncharacterized protein n=1 Tax=Photobacterium pectinilyticum TaxID=2906793 RepID=A0ABT1N7D2_9GAMM|nr:hypothetical protein [Photobacterium sp. ZSDE20]MCQ1060664.1 hypothetical protein [Photobacterium sp. ZSDE20]MDD1828237.1 hypothetical protein [Photobacterium sp. ZSDE20]